MNNIGPTYCVTAEEFLILGALSQCPSMVMNRKALMRHMRALCGISAPAGIINTLEAKGLIEVTSERKFCRLNELGALARRNPGHEEIPAYMTVPRSLFDPNWSAS